MNANDLLYFFDLLVRSGLVLLIAFGIIMLLPRLSAAVRCWILLLAIAALPMVPVTTALLPGVTLLKVEASSPAAAHPVMAIPDRPAPLPSADRIAPEVLALPEAVAATPSMAPRPEAIAATKPLRMVPMVYSAGVLVCLLPMLAGLLRLRGLRRRASPAPGFKVPAGVEVLLSSEIAVPMTWGTRRPVVLLPKSAPDWSSSRADVVIAHELAHINRRDFASGLFASAVRAAFWFQPLAWLACRRLRAEREIACDDRVLAGEVSSAPDYAEHLSAVAAGAGRVMEPAVAMARPSEIVGRVRAILDTARNRAALSGRGKTQLALLALAVFAPLAFVRCAGKAEHQEDDAVFETGIGTKMHPIDPSEVTITNKGENLTLPGGAPFSMAEREVTQAEFQKMMGHNPSGIKADHLPVTGVSVTEAAAFCKALTERDRAAGVLPKGKLYRLPTVREWAFAALPGGLVPSRDAIDAMAWHEGNSARLLHPVGAKKTNAYGLHDMIGNAAEWATPDPQVANNAATKIPVYEAQATVQYVGGSQAFGPESSRMSPFPTQIEIIRSRGTLDDVVAKLSLDKTWKLSPAECVTKLKSSLQVQQLRGTDLLRIRYGDGDASMAAQIANAITESYQARLESAAKQRAQKAIEALEAQMAIQKKKMETSRVAMLDIMEKYRIVDLSIRKPAWLGGAEARAATGAEAKPLLEADPKAALDTESNSLAERERNSLAERRQSIVYVESKKDYELNKEILNSMQSQLAKMKIDSRMTTPNCVIHEQAVVPTSPASHHASANLIGPGVSIALGGTALSATDELLEPIALDPESSHEAVGFRFVVADE